MAAGGCEMSVFDGVRVGEFKLHSGGTSPVLFDVPAMLWEPRDRCYVRDLLVLQMPDVAWDAIVGVEFGGAVLAALLAEAYPDKHLGFVRKSGEVIVPGDAWRCIVVDDVETTGASLREAQAALERAGNTVVGTVVLVRRCGSQSG